MIVIGVDVHKHSLTAVAVDEVGRTLAEVTAGDERAVLAWSASLPAGRLWALEDCRQLTRALERELLGAGEGARARAAEADGSGASCRQIARQVGRDRRARRGARRFAGAAAEPTAPGRAAVSRAEAAGRPPR